MEGGYTTNVCDICGKTEILEGAGALGHAFTSFVSDGNATCTEDGTKTAQCDRCGRAHTVTDPGSALGHCYDGGLIIQFPGCLTEGIMTYRCELCGDAYDEVLAAVGHQYDTSFMVPPACEETGYTVYSCTGCGDTFAEHDTPATGHLYDQGWCLYCGALEPGYARYTCSIQSFGDPEEPIYLELIPVGSPQAAYSYRLVDNTGEHHLNGIIPGDYTLAIHKKNHVSRYFTVSIQAGENHEDQPWKICLLGDVSGDGRVNVGDVAQLYSHIRKTNLITDEYALACADVTGDGRLNVGDTATLYSHVKNTKKLY